MLRTLSNVNAGDKIIFLMGYAVAVLSQSLVATRARLVLMPLCDVTVTQ